MFLLLSFNCLFSQQYLVKYKFVSKNDSLVYNLKINNNISIFEIDKTINIKEDKVNFESCDHMQIIKNNNNIIVYDKIERVDVSSEFISNLKWELKNKIGKYLDYETRMATVEYNKERWTVEYTTDIPINEGPFVFKFLPGLITSVKNDNKNILIQMIGIEKLSGFNICNSNNTKKLSFEKYLDVISQKNEIENSLLGSLQNIPGLKLGEKKIGKLNHDPIKLLFIGSSSN